MIEIIRKHKKLLNEDVFKHFFIKEYEFLSKINFPESFSFIQKLYHYVNNDFDLKLGTCLICGNRCKFISFNKGYKKYCSRSCSHYSIECQEKRKKTCVEKYGVEHSSKSKHVIEKMKNTNIEKYGVEYFCQSDVMKSKAEKTNLERYGVKYAIQSNHVQTKIKQTNVERYGVEHSLQSKEIRKKCEDTCMKKYDGTHPFKSNKIQEKVQKTNFEKYGVRFAICSNEIKDKIKKSKLNKYGIENTNSLQSVKRKKQESWINHYGVDNPAKAQIIKDKISSTNLERYGVLWTCMRPEARCYKNDSKTNKAFARLLDESNIEYEREFIIEKYSYDFKVGNILIEIDPIITHNCHLNIFDKEPKTKNYHLDKTNIAKKNGYACIHIWDWDDINKILVLLKPKKTLYARKLKVKRVDLDETNEFLNKYHLQNTCKGQTVRIGLFNGHELVQVMTFGKPRYNKKFEYELLRLCSHSDYIIVGGAEKIFKNFIDNYEPKNVISYCDYSKFNGNVYYKLGFTLKNSQSPSKHWYRQSDKMHITDNLLRQRGYDQLFDANYGKGTSNEELMLEHKFLPLYDCGQFTFIWENDKKRDIKLF